MFIIYVVMMATMTAIVLAALYMLLASHRKDSNKGFFDNPPNTVVFIHMQRCMHCVKFQKSFDEAKSDPQLAKRFKFEDFDANSEGAKQYSTFHDGAFPCYMAFDGKKGLLKKGAGYLSTADFKAWLP